MFVNVWIALRDDAQAAIKTRLDADDSGDPYSGPVDDRTARLFHRMIDRNTVQRLFKIATAGGRDYTLWSVNFDEPGNVLQKIKDELDRLAVEYPNRFIIAGAWLWDGSQVAGYPPDARLDRFMPDDIDEQGSPVPNPTVRDINLLFGQSPRIF